MCPPIKIAITRAHTGISVGHTSTHMHAKPNVTAGQISVSDFDPCTKIGDWTHQKWLGNTNQELHWRQVHQHEVHYSTGDACHIPWGYLDISWACMSGCSLRDRLKWSLTGFQKCMIAWVTVLKSIWKSGYVPWGNIQFPYLETPRKLSPYDRANVTGRYSGLYAL